MTTVNQNARYASAAERNVRLLRDRILGVNTGNALTRVGYLTKFSGRGVTLPALKTHAGVRASDSHYDDSLQKVLDQVAAFEGAKKKAEKVAVVPTQAAPEKQEPSEQAPTTLDKPHKKFKKGRRPSLTN